jgi:serine/threonine-protein kinase
MDPTQRTPAGDQYSLGCVLYFCLTGQYPFPEGTAVEKMMAHQTKQPPPIKDVSPETPDQLVAVVDRLMQKTPASRYGNVAEAIEALRPLASESPEPGSKYTAQPIVQVPPNGLATLAPEVTRPAPAPSRKAVDASTAPAARSTAVPPAPASPPPLSPRPVCHQARPPCPPEIGS